MASQVQLSAEADLVDAVNQLTAIAASLGPTPAVMFQWQQQTQELIGQGDAAFADPATYAADVAALVTGMSMLLAPLDANGNPIVSTWSEQLSRPSIGMNADQVAQVFAAQMMTAAMVPSKPVLNRTTPQRQQELANQNALFALIVQTALLEACGAILAMDFASRDQALATRDQLGLPLEAASLAAADLFQEKCAAALDDARRAMTAQIQAEAAQLPLLVAVTPPATVPAVVLAHRIYDDPSWDADLVARNGIVNPLFVSGGAPLEVLAP